MIRQAVTADDWIDIGALAEERSRPKRPTAHYKAYDSTVELYDKTYRAIVVHSSAHDKRRHKRIDRLLKQDRNQLEKICKQVTDTAFFVVPTLRQHLKNSSIRQLGAIIG